MKKILIIGTDENGKFITHKYRDIKAQLEKCQQPKRQPNPDLKRHNYIFANQIEVIDAEIVANKKIN